MLSEWNRNRIPAQYTATKRCYLLSKSSEFDDFVSHIFPGSSLVWPCGSHQQSSMSCSYVKIWQAVIMSDSITQPYSAPHPELVRGDKDIGIHFSQAFFHSYSPWLQNYSHVSSPVPFDQTVLYRPGCSSSSFGTNFRRTIMWGTRALWCMRCSSTRSGSNQWAVWGWSGWEASYFRIPVRAPAWISVEG